MGLSRLDILKHKLEDKLNLLSEYSKTSPAFIEENSARIAEIQLQVETLQDEIFRLENLEE